MDSVRYIVGQESATRQVSEATTRERPEVRGLVERAADGDVEAFGELYGIYLNCIYRYVLYQVDDRAAAEDITEEIFIKAWRGISKYKWRGFPFSAWLYRIARNHVVDYFRTRHQHQPLEVELLAGDDGPERAAERKQIQQSLSRAIFSLSQQQKQLIILKFIEGLDNRDIEGIMGKSQGAIRVMQMRALAALRRMLNEEMEEWEPIYQRS